MIVCSKYRLFAVGLMILMNLVSALYFIFVFYTICDKNLINVWHYKYAILVVLVGIPLEFICLMFFFTQFKRIEISDNSISFATPLIPSLCTSTSWTDYDSCYSVQEYTSYRNYEAIWLIKDMRIKNRISSFYYSNYLEMRDAIKIDIKGQLKMTPLQQLLCMMGRKIKNIS